MGPQQLRIDRFPLGQAALSKQLPEGVVVELLSSNSFEIEQVILLRIHVDSMDMPGACQRVINRIAPSRSDHNNAILRRQFQGHSIESRILPALVVDDVSSVNEVEPSLTQSFDKHAASVRGRIKGKGTRKGGKTLARALSHAGLYVPRTESDSQPKDAPTGK